MKTIIHISDLHFGKIDQALSSNLCAAFAAFNSDLVIISGDLTQRATSKQFLAAQALLENMQKEGITYFVIPGNHDIEPMFNPGHRAVTPYRKYKKYISQELEPVYHDDEVAVIGINTVSRLNIKAGTINRKQIKHAAALLDAFPNTLKKIVVTHHPIDLPDVYSHRKLVSRASKTLQEFSKHGVDVYLSGHYHRSSVIIASQRFNIKNHPAIAVQAGTLSIRGRGEVPSFNVLRIGPITMSIETYAWDTKGNLFKISSEKRFKFENDQWLSAEDI